MSFDIVGVSFSRYGSYLAISQRGDGNVLPHGVYLRTLHGDTTMQEVFRIELIADGKPVAFATNTTPSVLRLESKQGYAEFCFACPKSIRFLAKGVGVRLSLTQTVPYGFAMPIDGGRWTVNSFAHRSSYVLSVLKGKLAVDAPWEGMKCKRVILDFQPVGRSGSALEGAIEEFTSIVPANCHTRTFKACADEVATEFADWLKRSPAVPDRLAVAGKLAAYVNWSAVVAAEGHFRRPAMLMSKNHMFNVWSWDHCFNAIALSYHNPQMAWDQLLVVFDHQDAGGAPPDSYNDRAMVRNFVKPPIHGWTLRHLMKRTEWITPGKLKEFYEPLCRWTNWWMDNRDSDHDGIPQYSHGNDSGWDNSTSFDIGTPLEGPDLSAFLIIQMDVLAEVAGRIGKKRDANRWQKRADQLLEHLLAHNWRGDHFIAPRSGDHEVAQGGDSLVLQIPLVLGKRLPSEIAGKLVMAVREEGRFLTPHGLATESIKSPKYLADGYWRGPIWAPSTMLIVDGLAQLGQKALAREIAKRFCQTVAASGMAENFDALTGKALRDPAYTWTSSVFQILAHDYLRGEM